MEELNLLLIGILESENRENWEKAIFKVVMAENLLTFDGRGIE